MASPFVKGALTYRANDAYEDKDGGSILLGVRKDSPTAAALVDADSDLSPVIVDQYGRLIMVASSLDTLDNVVKTEDAAHSSGDQGVFIVAVRNDAQGTLVGTDGDYAPFSVNSVGHLLVSVGRVEVAEDDPHVNGQRGVTIFAVRRDAAASSAGADGDNATINVDASGRLWTHVGAIDAGETHVGEVGGNTTIVRLNPTVTAGAYSANDVVGGELTLTNAMRVSGGSGVLHAITVHDAAAQNVALDIYVFDSAPAANLADNAAWAWTAGDEDKFLGLVRVAASDYVSAAGDGFVTLRNLGLPVKANGSANLYCYIVTTGTPTYAATTDLTLSFGFLRD
ncbi:MAG: hypothetical protein C4523_19610 [Myxococcales bacterium]|nr:MAG: hypothetical protein C4523_19610 [Myxococcales bacterium]